MISNFAFAAATAVATLGAWDADADLRVTATDGIESARTLLTEVADHATGQRGAVALGSLWLPSWLLRRAGPRDPNEHGRLRSDRQRRGLCWRIRQRSVTACAGPASAASEAMSMTWISEMGRRPTVI